MRTVAGVLSLAAATALVAGCHTSAELPAKAAGVTVTPFMPARARPVTPRPAVGALFLGGTDTHTCTASVVRSKTQNLILTAAHCLASGDPATFVPGFNGLSTPDDVWTVDAAYFDPRWLAHQNPKADYAFARVSRPAGGAVESVAGQALTLGVEPGEFGAVTVVGYPLGIGGPPIGCSTVAGMEAGGYPSVRCGGLVDGTSGAPWIQGSAVIGVTGGREGGGCQDDISYSSPFDAATAALLARAEVGGPGDDAPEASDTGC
jgi:hypothetical protein